MTINSEDLKLDKKPLTFGKYKGLTPDEVSETDPGWVIWAHDNVKWPVCSEYLYEVCKDEKAGKKRTRTETTPALDEEDDLDGPSWGEDDDIPF